MQRHEFTHTIVCEAQHLQAAARVVLHTICFHRFLGTVKPAYLEVFGATFPAIADAQVDALLARRAAQLHAACTAANKACLTIHFLPPTSKLASALDTQTTEASRPGSSAATTATTTAASLRAWASPRSYPYGWLAHAFSSGAGQPSSTFVPAPVHDDAAAHAALVDAEAFETWTVTFEVQRAGQVRVREELGGFVDEAVRFVERNKTHLPAITSGELCTYPMHVFVRGAG
ncbi:conserved hypothetical protein [Sporisorium reilianum SRZ2]|uniref:Autophagy-related protein 101 n=1 Tax=Sporisorium reilianum (strain SRZ2) TaxID=999809 RepID=E7A2L6_SPORE|nr:conserved hypothetical protein [Sporisorium reilianum SRZ2]